jgi:hypothetical protein
MRCTELLISRLADCRALAEMNELMLVLTCIETSKID